MNTFVKTAVSLLVLKGAIHQWSPGENISYIDLNAALNHIHTKMVGGHGARLVDADVSASASISSSKLAAYRMIPVAWATVQTVCTVGTCTMLSSQGVTSVTRSSAGVYTVTLSVARPNTSFSAIAAAVRSAGGAMYLCYVGAIVSTSTVPVICSSDLVPTAVDGAFSITVFDNDS